MTSLATDLLLDEGRYDRCVGPEQLLVKRVASTSV